MKRLSILFGLLLALSAHGINVTNYPMRTTVQPDDWFWLASVTDKTNYNMSWMNLSNQIVSIVLQFGITNPVTPPMPPGETSYNPAVVSQMMFLMGDDNPGCTNQLSVTSMQPMDSSGMKNDCSEHVLNYTHITTSTNTPAGAGSSLCYEFDGGGALWPGANFMYVSPGTNVGVEAWVRVGNLAQSNQWVFGTSPDKGIGVAFNGSRGLTAMVHGGEFGTPYSPASTNEWVHCAVVNMSGTNTFYVNGSSLGSSNADTEISYYYQWKQAVNNDLATFFTGAIDDYRLFTFPTNAFTVDDLLYTTGTSKPKIGGLPTWPTASQDDTNIIATAGETLQLKCVVKGAAPIHYAWRVNGSYVSTNQTLVISNLTLANSGTYRLVASNSFGVSTSTLAQVTVKNLITMQQGTNATLAQLDLINRKYGMFIHFGPQTFDTPANENYNYSPPAISSYTPASVNPAQWVACAYNAGARYVILVAKHSSGFCLWPTATSAYHVGNSPVTNDIVAETAAACASYGTTNGVARMKLGLYLSYWDEQHYGVTTGPMWGRPYTGGFFTVMTNQLTELLTHYGPICELWFDGQWKRQSYSWHPAEIYHHVKSLQSDCSVMWNWNITRTNDYFSTLLPSDMQYGDLVMLFPSDGRTADPHYPANVDIKIYSNPNIPGSKYFLSYESPITIQSGGTWFWHLTNDVPITDTTITNGYTYCVARDAAFLVNVPPDTNGLIPVAYSNVLRSAAIKLGIAP